jgi:hypothetical protein
MTPRGLSGGARVPLRSLVPIAGRKEAHHHQFKKRFAFPLRESRFHNILDALGHHHAAEAITLFVRAGARAC